MRSSVPIVFLASLAAPGAFAAAAPEEWVEGPQRPSLNGESGKVWFSPKFGRKQGTFPAMYDAVGDDRDSVTGDFLAARFRYTYDAPIGEDTAENEAGHDLIPPRHDESITEVLLDCDRHFSGTVSTRFLLKGKEVRHQRDDDQDILMTQVMGDAGTTVGDLCEFARQRGAK